MVRSAVGAEVVVTVSVAEALTLPGLLLDELAVAVLGSVAL